MELLYSLIFIVVVTTFITCRPSGGDNSKKMERDGETAMEDIEMIDKDGKDQIFYKSIFKTKIAVCSDSIYKPNWWFLL